MGERGRIWKGRSLLIAFFVLFAVFGSLASDSYGEEPRSLRYGFSVFGGGGDAWRDADFIVYGIMPRIDVRLHRNWDLEIEGNYSYWNLRGQRNLYFLGVDVNVLYKPIQGNWGSFFLLAGAGIGYDSAGRKVEQIGDSHVGGILQVGTGFFINLGKRTALRIEYRLYHISEPFRDDSGLNSHNALVGISF